MQIQNFWVDIENLSGQKLGAGPLRAMNFNSSSLLDACGDFSFDVAATDPNLSVLAEKRVAVCRYVDRAGQLQEFAIGIIDKITRDFAADGSLVLHVSGNDVGRELTYRSVGTLDLSGVDGAGVSDAPAQIMALAPDGWTLDQETPTGSNLYAAFDGESVLNALARAAEKLGEHWRIDPSRIVTWLNASGDFIASGVRAVQHVDDPVSVETAPEIAVIRSLEEESDVADLVTRIYPRGSGNGGVTLTLASITDTAPAGYTVNATENYIERDDSVSTYGRIERVLDFKDIGPISNTTPDLQAAANTLMSAGVEYLRQYGTPQKFYRIELAWIGQLLQPGTTLRVIYHKTQDGLTIYDLDADFIILKTENQISAEGVHTTAVTVSTIDRMPQSDNSYLVDQAVSGRIAQAHQQLSASVDTMSFRDEMDDEHGASFRFWMGNEYTSLQRVLLRFRIQPLRSTVKSVGGNSTSTASGGGGTSGSGGGLTATGGSHEHNTEILPAAPNASDIGFYADGGLVGLSSTGAHSGDVFQVGVSTSHSHTIPSHTHTTPNHTHDVTAAINMQYGIFEESGANTLALSDLVIKLNNGDDLHASVSDIGNGWYELDLTDEIVDEVFRPAQENNEIEITTATAKTARIEAQITIRGVVQAVAYSS